MPSLNDYPEIREALRAAIVSAWTVRPTSVKFGMPLLPKNTSELPYVCCQLQNVTMSFASGAGTVRGLGQDVVFKLFCAFRRPEPTQDTESFNVDKFNDLAPVFEASELFAGVGMLPHVSEFDPRDWFDPWEGATGFTLDLSMLVRRTWGT